LDGEPSVNPSGFGEDEIDVLNGAIARYIVTGLPEGAANASARSLAIVGEITRVSRRCAVSCPAMRKCGRACPPHGHRRDRRARLFFSWNWTC